MNGHETIIQMRQSGRMPGFVFINDYPCKTRWAEWGEYATICTYKDPVSKLDMRFLVGLKVSISATSEDRAKALFDLCKAAGVKSVAACHVIQGQHPTKQTGWAEAWHSTQMETA